jgi:hypothetical protein
MSEPCPAPEQSSPELGSGLLAEFAEAPQLLAAAKQLRERGYRALDAHTPFPVPGLAEQLGLSSSPLPALALAGGLLGGSLGYFMLWYSAVVDYPLNVGGRPLHSWPAFVPVTFELTVLSTAFTIFFAVLYLCRLTRLHQPIFAVPGFGLDRARFYLRVEASDPLFDPERTRGELSELQPEAIHALP